MNIWYIQSAGRTSYPSPQIALPYQDRPGSAWNSQLRSSKSDRADLDGFFAKTKHVFCCHKILWFSMVFLYFFQCLGNFWAWEHSYFIQESRATLWDFFTCFFHAFPSLVILRSFEVIFLGVGWGYQKSTTGTLFIICISLLHIFHNLDAFKRSLI
jgi:hypothetical protein